MENYLKELYDSKSIDELIQQQNICFVNCVDNWDAMGDKKFDLSLYKEYAKHITSNVDLEDFFQDLEKSLNREKKEGKGLQSLLTTFGRPDLEITSWKFREWDYVNPNISLPSNARGLFTIDAPEKKIIIRGYDKFFNMNECAVTKTAHLAESLVGPYEVTLKSNGCIILISGLEDGTIVVCSKHSTGHREDSFKNHALQGKRFLERQLSGKGISERDFALALYELNVTAVAEYCDDEFEEHVLKYSGDDAGLYLHGLNFNIPEFKTFPFDYVVRFGNMFGFKETKYFIETDFDKMLGFFNEAAETGMYNGQEVEGFVIRSKQKGSDEVFFWKYKFEEPYLMYREWREATKKLLKVRDLNDSSLAKNKPVTKEYLRFVFPIITKNQLIADYYSQNHGIIDLRNMFLEHIGKKGYELTDSNVKSSTNELSKEQVDDKVDFLVQKLSKVQLNVAQVEANEARATQEKITTIHKFIFIPIATIGCGKTTVALTLQKLFPDWGVIENDNLLQNKKFKNRLERKALEYLAGHDDALQEENLNTEVEEFLKNPKKYKDYDSEAQRPEKLNTRLDKNNVIIVDRNNHMYRERKDLINTFERLKKRFFPNHNEYIDKDHTHKIRYQFNYIALNFLTEENFGNSTVRNSKELWKITHDRILYRGTNHQSIKLDSENDLAKVDEIMKGFINRFQICQPWKAPDSLFNLVINLDVLSAESSRKNVNIILDTLRNKMPQVFKDQPLPDEKNIDFAFQSALAYKPTITKVVRGSGAKNQKPVSTRPKGPRIVYFGIEIPQPKVLLGEIESLLSDKLPRFPNANNLYKSLIETERVQNRFHITLVHVAQKENKQIFKDYLEIFKSSNKFSGKGTAFPVGNILFDVKLEKLVWDTKAVAVLVKIVNVKNTKNTIQYANNHLHVTIGTASKDIRPVYSNQLLDFSADRLSVGSEGIFDNDIHILNWNNDILLEDLPLKGYCQ